MERDKYMFDTILIVPWITHVMFVNLKVILWVKKVAVCRKDIKISITLTWPHLGTDEYLEKQKEKSSKVNLNNQEIIALMLSYYLNNCWLYSISNDSFKLLYFIPFLKKCYFPELKKLRFKLKKTSNVWFMAQLKQDQKTMCLFLYYHTYFFWNKVICRSTGKGVTSPLYNINIITYLNNSLTYSINQRNVKARTTMSRGMHDDTFFFFFLTSWLMQMQIPGFHLYIEVIQNFSALPCSEFIPHPLTYVSIESPFYPKVIVANNEVTGHFFSFLSLALLPLLRTCLKDCQSQESLLQIARLILQGAILM